MYKKVVFYIAGASLALPALADGSLNVWGAIDLALARTQSTASLTSMMSGNNQGASKIGVNGQKDLAEGLWSGFALEAGVNPQSGTGAGSNGAVTFNRRSTASLGGDWGEVRIGHDFNLTFENYVLGDPFFDNGITGAGDLLTYANGSLNPQATYFASNTIKYSYGFAKNGATWGFGTNGLYAEAMLALPGTPDGTPNNGQYVGGRIGYASGPYNVAVAYASSKGQDQNLTAGSSIGYSEFNVAATYKLESMTLAGNVGYNNSDTANTKFNHVTFGATFPRGKGEFPVSVSYVTKENVANASATMVAFGYNYHLSDSTTFYALASHTSNGSAMALGSYWVTVNPGANVDAYAVGVAVTF